LWYKQNFFKIKQDFFHRVYSEEEYQMLETYSTPELQRVPLDSLLLQMMAMGLPDCRKFPFIEPPPIDNIENAIFSLKDHVGIWIVHVRFQIVYALFL